ncbi:hypothetical protein SAY87_008127 [Trapa incisa]|uniref:Elongin-A n=1 Tax=Trapa incisa TaxID=236973 RepID=A0AAN7KGI1_9MYRT|nr:hypothetical protein SAY87_008127 [Trapa incisa]
MQLKRKIPSLVDLCTRTAIDNVRYLGDVGETDLDLLEHILPHCTVDQLMHVENSTMGRDLSPVTDKLWKKFYEKQFGPENANIVMKRMKHNNVSFKWMKLYEAKLKDVEEAQNKSLDRIRQLYKKEDACNGPGYNVSNVKSNLMKKAKIEFLKSQEVKNMTAVKKNAIQRHPCVSPFKRPSGIPEKGPASTSKQISGSFTVSCPLKRNATEPKMCKEKRNLQRRSIKHEYSNRDGLLVM